MIDDDHSHHVADHASDSESWNENSQGKGNEICSRLCDEKNNHLDKTC